MAEDNEDGQSGGGKKKMAIIGGLVALLLIGGGAGAYFTGALDGLLGKKKNAEATAEGEAVAGGKGEAAVGKDGKVDPKAKGATGNQVVFYDLPEMLVDLTGDPRKRTFLKIRVSLELNATSEVPSLEAVLPRIIDSFQSYLRELRIDDLQGDEGIYRLREELLLRVNQAIQPTKVKDVLFKEMLLQ